MDQPTIYQSNASEIPLIRKWVIRGLVVSLLIHFAIYVVFNFTKLERFSTQTTTRLVPRQFTVAQLEVNEELLNQEETSPTEPEANEVPIQNIPLPTEQNVFEEQMETLRATPAAPDLEKPLLAEKPKVDTESMEALTALQQSTASTLESELDSVRESLIHDAPKITAGSQLQLPDTSGDTAPGTGTPEFSNLDALLSQAGGLKKGTAPILMPTDLLFDYNSADLRPAAVSSLRKLGELITRNPNVIFSIEGHADAFGSPAYNLALSERRAESVRGWLVTAMRIDPRNITTKGYGATRLIAPANASVEEQQINRRVEIVMRFP
jgi:outer membrane protein OmpA-like peptidoglycan-associated protein